MRMVSSLVADTISSVAAMHAAGVFTKYKASSWVLSGWFEACCLTISIELVESAFDVSW